MSTGPTPWNGPLLVRAHAIPAIGLVASVEVETSETGSPVFGTDGNHVNDATGGEGVVTGEGVTGEGVTVNVTGSLLPAGFEGSELGWVATAVYCPLERAGLALLDVQALPLPVAVAIETTGPFAVVPAWIWTVTGVRSLAAPVKDGVVLLEGEVGRFTVTVGAAVKLVFTMNRTGGLVPVSEVRLVCFACAV